MFYKFSYSFALLAVAEQAVGSAEPFPEPLGLLERSAADFPASSVGCFASCLPQRSCLD